jgi:hypothetical protein
MRFNRYEDQILSQNLLYLLVAILIYTLPAVAVTREEVCQYASDFCDRLWNSDGQPVKPLPEVVEALKYLNPEIKRVAADYGIDPRAVIGAILTEHSLNVTKTHSDMKDFIYWAKLEDVVKAVKGTMPSIGFGQIKPDVALTVEEKVAKKEGRPPRTLDEIKKFLKNPYESVKYAAALVRDGQDAYKERGFDISGDPSILATVYNIGRPAKHADDAKSENRNPRVNFFGYFVGQNLGLIDEIAKFTPPQSDSAKRSTFLSGSGVELFPYPPDCDPKANASMHDYTRDQTYNKASPIGSGAGFYKVIGHGVDCDMKPWSLVRTGNGRTGWASDDILQANTTKFPAGAVACSKQTYDTCRKQLLQTIPGLTEVGRDRSGSYTLRLNRKKSDEPADFKKWTAYCLKGTRDVVSTASSGRQGKSRTKLKGIEITRENVATIKDQMAKKRDELVKQLGAEIVDDPKWEFYSLLHPDELNKCGTTQRCFINSRLFDEFLKDDLSKAFTSYRGAQELMTKYLNTIRYHDLTEVSLKDAVAEVERQCQTVFPDFPAVQVRWHQFKTDNAKEIAKADSTIELSEVSPTLFACQKIKSMRSNANSNQATEECKNEVLKAAVALQSTYYVKSLLEKMISDKADQEAFLDNMFQWSSFGGQPSGPDEKVVCNYDPNALARDVEMLAQNSCVETVLVPDMSIVKKYTSQGSKKVSFSQFEDADIYAVRIKGACDE